LSTQSPYSIRQTCGTKQELAHLTPDEYNKKIEDMDATGEIEQVRMPLGPMPDFLKGGQTPPKPFVPEVACPVCLDDLPEDIPEKFCLARHVYKVDVRGARKYPLKIYADLRPKTGKENIQVYSKYSLPETCECRTLTLPGKVLVMTKESEVKVINKKRKRGEIHLDSDVTVVPMGLNVRGLEKSLRHALKKICDKK
jgi:hypothetical protein